MYFWLVGYNFLCIEFFNVELLLFGVVGDVGEKCGISWVKVNDVRVYKNGIFFVVVGEFIL